ncbi:MAG: C/D box methylation guide ribonucleoprotein complex aNOP56 subunit [Candidatus Bathyarchaeia archaeon]
MKVAVVPSVIGVLAINEEGKIIDKEVFEKDAVKVAEKLFALEQGRIIPEVRSLVERLKVQNHTLIFESPELADLIREEFKVNAEAKSLTIFTEKLRENMGEISVEIGFLKEPNEITRWMREVTIELSKLRIKRATEKRDLLVIQAVHALDDLDQTLNLFASRIREWYGIHFPELSRLIDRHETFARLVYLLGRRENFTSERLEKEGFPKNKITQIIEAARSSMGADLEDKDIEQLRKLSKQVIQLYDIRANMEKYVEELMEEVAPNLKALAGPSLGARLIALAGGLENLAKLPASTVQVLGAEKALFRALRTGSKPPKHGVIFQHSLIFRAKKWLRGKIARALAGKLSIAARTDAFTGSYVGDKLKEDLMERIKEIEEKYPTPPKVKKPAKKIIKKAKARGKK